MVAPLAGAWIEIFAMLLRSQATSSLPSRERGLKFDFTIVKVENKLSLPSRERGLKSFYLNNLCRIRLVAPLAGAWIEICGCIITVAIHFGRSPRGSVD